MTTDLFNMSRAVSTKVNENTCATMLQNEQLTSYNNDYAAVAGNTNIHNYDQYEDFVDKIPEMKANKRIVKKVVKR